MSLVRFLVVSSLVFTGSLSFAQGLNIGDKAPALNVTKWVKGSPQKIGNGQITVVEFWATWCGPCRQSIPHLTELAHKYKGKVNFVGVSIWERADQDYTTKVPAFVKEFGSKMDYNVATEGPGKYMATKWMTAAGENGIPTAFLVNKEGKVAWIGHPMGGLSEAIDGVVSGKVNLAKARTERSAAKGQQMNQQKAQQQMVAKLTPTINALKAKQYQTASNEADKLIKGNDKTLKSVAMQYKLSAMTLGNLKGLDTYLTTLGNEPFAKSPTVLNNIVWIVVEKDLKLAPSAYKSAAKLGEKMMSMAPNDAMDMDTYALALFRAGDKKKALEIQKRAVSVGASDKRIDANTMKELKGRLKLYGG